MDADKLNLLGHEVMVKGQIDQALDYFQKAIKVNPLLPQSHYNAGVCYMARGQYELALINYKKALSLSPNNTVILTNIGVTYDKMDNKNYALKYYKKAVGVEPTNIFALSSIGSIYISSNPKKAIEYLKKAIKINPNLSDGHFNLGICLGSTGNTTDAIKHFEETIKLDPRYSPTYGHLQFQLRKNCEWKRADEIFKTVKKVNENNLKDGILPAQTPFEAVVFNDNLKENFDIARVWSKYIESQVTKKAYPFEISKNKKVRVGFLSSDFYNHATAHLTFSFFNDLPADKFEYFIYSYGIDDKSRYRIFFESFKGFRDISIVSDFEAAEIINRDKIDILIDMKGYTERARLGICALKPAPILVSFLGFPGTTGASFIDYIIADSIVIPEKDDKFYSENIVRLPFTYQPTDNTQPILQNETKKSFNLPEKGFLFCSFNQSYKIDDKTLSSWIKIIKKVKNSYLCLLSENKEVENNLKKAFSTAGCNSDRLVFMPNLPKAKHLARISFCDLSLDTFICNGHTTTSDCLWAGTPVISLLGNHFASRVSASLLTAIGLPELITHSKKEYETLAIYLATHPKKLQAISYQLNANRYTHPIFNTDKFIKNFETALEKIYDKYRKNEFPENIYIKDNITKETSSMAQNNLGTIYLENKDFKNATKYLKNALKISPNNALANNNYGTLQKAIGNSNEAVKYWKKALTIDENLIESISNLGIYYLDTGQNEKAKFEFEKIIKLNPKDSSAFNNLGIVYLNQSIYPKAIENLKMAVKLNPNDYAATYHLGLAYRFIDDYKNSIKYLKRSLELKPDYGPALNIYTLLLMQICDFSEFNKYAGKIQLEHESPYVNVARVDSQELNLKVAKLRSSEIEKSVKGLTKPFSYHKHSNKLRIGYLSRDYFEHATAYLIEGLFINHDKNKFETFAYSYGPNDASLYRRKFEQEVDHFIDISNMGHVEAAQRINSDKIDILIDLKGHTKDNRLEIMALKPAPIQVSYLGFPGTIGSNFIDYIITDKIITPPNCQKYYTEKFAYMPDTYQINYDKRRIANIDYKRKDFDLPEKSFVFSCFNHTSKIDKETFISWMNILKRVPNSVLWLLSSNEIAEENLKKEAKNLKINPDRLIFARHIENSHHLARITLSDLSLDTFIYNGHTTTSDSLWVGVPVVSLQGKHFASRVASSLLSAVGLPELVTHTQKEYEDLAIKIANDKNLNIKLKQKLKENKLKKPLYNTKLFVQNLEKLYKKIYERRI